MAAAVDENQVVIDFELLRQPKPVEAARLEPVQKDNRRIASASAIEMLANAVGPDGIFLPVPRNDFLDGAIAARIRRGGRGGRNRWGIRLLSTFIHGIFSLPAPEQAGEARTRPVHFSGSNSGSAASQTAPILSGG